MRWREEGCPGFRVKECFSPTTSSECASGDEEAGQGGGQRCLLLDVGHSILRLEAGRLAAVGRVLREVAGVVIRAKSFPAPITTKLLLWPYSRS